MDTEIIENFDAVRLLINIYMIKEMKNYFKPVNQEKFVEEVCAEFKERNLDYPRKSILFTWKHLLDTYKQYKQNYTVDNAREAWQYFDLMDKCFDNSKPIAAKFDDKCIMYLIKSLGRHRLILFQHGLTMGILQEVENDFRQLGNNDINQKDIYNQWLNLKKVYKKYLSTNSKIKNYYSYYSALKKFFESDVLENSTECISQNELDTAIDSIRPIETTNEIKKRKSDSSECDENTRNVKPCTYTTFTAVMQDILLNCLKRNTRKIQHFNGELDEVTLNEVVEQFNKRGYDVSKSLIRNEWNDLSCRYELIKNSEHPEQWPFFEDVSHIYATDDLDNVDPADDIANDAESDNVRNLLRNNQKVSMNDVETSEKLLNVYECNNREFLEIKDILIERNLLREETNYLLNIFVEKFNKKQP